MSACFIGQIGSPSEGNMYEIIVNPGARSGKAMKLWRKIEQMFAQADLEYRVNFTGPGMENEKLICRLYEEYAAKGEKLHLVLMGGDGTINEVLQWLPGFDNVNLTLLPMGSGNDLVRDLLGTTNTMKAVMHFINSPTCKSADLGLISLCCSDAPELSIPKQNFIVSTGIGYDAGICEEVARSRVKNLLNALGLGQLSYLIIALKQLIGIESCNATLSVDGAPEISLKNFILMAGMNHRFQGGGFLFAPDASDTDGMLDLCVVANVSRAKVLRIMPSAKNGCHYRYDGVEFYRASNYRLRTDRPFWVHTDGEVRSKADTIEVKIRDEKVNLVY